MFFKILQRKLLLPFAVSTLAEGRGVNVSPQLLARANKKRIKLSFPVEMFNCLFHNAAFVSESQFLQSRLQMVSIGLFLSCLLHRNCILSEYFVL